MNKTLLATLALLTVTGCASTQNSPNTTSGATCPAQEGQVLDVQRVTIERNTQAAQAIGAGLGGYVANEATKDSDEVVRVLATALGAGAGAIAGDRVADATQDLSGFELVVQLDRGVHSIIQQDTPYRFLPGDQVWVIGYPEGRRYTRTTNCGQEVRVFPRGR